MRRHFARRTALLAGLAAMGFRAARAAERVDLIVGAMPGTLADHDARAFVPFLERHLARVGVRVVNCPGGAGLAGFEALAKAKPDGSALGWAVTPTLAARTIDTPGAERLLERVGLVGAVMKEPIALVTPKESALASTQDIIRRSSEDADAVRLGTPPVGGPPHLAALRLQSLAATRLNIVAFPSSAAAREAVLGGNVEAAVLALADVIGALRDGTLAGLGIAARDRTELFPQMPALHESGLPLTAHIRRGLALPVSTPDAVAATLAATLHDIATDPEFQSDAQSNGFSAVWCDGKRWNAETLAEQAELARLWREQRWLPSSTS
jgi:tripartite-type tricarboxylate transporter receptor subunit TctC